ncbi:MAG TPA: hypothetical protein VEK34_09665 [Methylocella sp.]|nr:hypothetical protein [Methylocella sp.]
MIAGVEATFFCREDLELHISSLLTSAPGWVESKIRAEAAKALEVFDRGCAAYDAKVNVAELNEADRSVKRAMSALADAERAVLKTEPHTLPGTIALLLFTARHMADGLPVESGDVTDVLINAAHALAGLNSQKTLPRYQCS